MSQYICRGRHIIHLRSEIDTFRRQIILMSSISGSCIQFGRQVFRFLNRIRALVIILIGNRPEVSLRTLSRGGSVECSKNRHVGITAGSK
jgi:hypothetical protein